MRVNDITGVIVDAAMKVHRELGPGLLESAYEACLTYERRKRGLQVQSQVGLPVVYDGHQVDLGYRLDLLVEGSVVVELKSVDAINAVHEAQILSYLKLSHKPVGLLINFHSARLKDGIRRFLNGPQPETAISAAPTNP